MRNYEDDDLENILNYEHSEEIKQYEEQLKSEYRLTYDTDYIEQDNTDVGRSNLKKSDSFASLMNILNTMRKSNLSKSVSASRLNLMQNMKEKDSVSPVEPKDREVKVVERRESLEKIITRKEITSHTEELAELREMMKLRKVNKSVKGKIINVLYSELFRHPQIP